MVTEIRARAVLLDMDGTLVDSSAVVERVWSGWAETHGLEPADVMQVVHGRQGHESMAILLPHRSRAENLADNRLVQAREVEDVAGVVEVRGAARLLASLAGHPHALVTSATEPLARARMTAAGLTVPAAAVTAERVAASKPDPEGFLLAARELGVAPADCVVFEDSGAGIEAAHRAGMRVVGVAAGADVVARHGVDRLVPDLRGVHLSVDGDELVITFDGTDGPT